jgi:Family of unknown function (DUF5677)
MGDIREYTERVKSRHREAFDLWAEVARVYQNAQAVPRSRRSDLHIVLDMLMLQASNTHAALALLAQHGLMEDTATLARRLLEISIQATYIAADDDQRTRDRRAGSYLAFLWRRLPRRVKSLLPPTVRSEWSMTARRYGRFVGRKAKRWGPDWRTMFRECQAEDLYDSDYAFLSGVAHGSPEEQIVRFSLNQIRAHDDRHVSHLLIYGSKYLAVVGEHWNGLFGIVVQHEIDDLRASLVNWRGTKR